MNTLKQSSYIEDITFKKTVFGTYKAIAMNEDLQFVGQGRSAAVYRMKGTKRVIKAFFPPYEELALKEAAVYRRLSKNPYFPNCYETGLGYLILDYVEGTTLFECLEKGISIPLFALKEIDETFCEIEKQGIYAVDMHLKNLIYTKEHKIKIIDVARYSSKKEDERWRDFRKTYDRFYDRSFLPKRYPRFVLHTMGFIYKRLIEKRGSYE